MSFNHNTTNRSILFTLPLALFALSQTPVQAAPTAASPSVSASAAVAPELGSAISWDAARQDKRITALAQDNRGRIFAASEESGVWMRGTSRHSDKQWRRFNTQNSSIADDNIYALTVDGQGRVWAGTASHGVSVFNGRSWKNYNPLQAPIGERIFDIAVNPLDGDVWIASNVGLTRYSQKNDKWTTLYAAEKLPFNHLQSLAFSASGSLFAGTQSDGLLICAPQKNERSIEYSLWRVVKAPAVVPDVSSGSGLPSNLVNDVLVSRNDTVYVATTAGLAWSRDKGATWQYRRGRDYVNKARGRLASASVPAAVKELAPTDKVWSEDTVSCLAEDGGGNIWLGHWRQGYEVWDDKLQTRVLNGAPGDKSDDSNSNGDGDYVKCILALNGQAPLIGRYGFGLTVAPRTLDQSSTQTAVTTKDAKDKPKDSASSTR